MTGDISTLSGGHGWSQNSVLQPFSYQRPSRCDVSPAEIQEQAMEKDAREAQYHAFADMLDASRERRLEKEQQRTAVLQRKSARKESGKASICDKVKAFFHQRTK